MKSCSNTSEVGLCQENTTDSSRGLGLQKQRTFPAKTFPERCYGSNDWYPKCDVLVPHVLPLIPYFSTTSQPLLTPIPNPKQEGGRGGSARPSATIASHPRRLRVTVARPSDRSTDPSCRSRHADPALDRETNKIIKGDRRARRASHLRASAGARSLKSS